MFLETHLTIVDDQKRYLNLTEICKNLSGFMKFGEWVDKGDYIECYAIWMAIFGTQFNNILVDLDLYWSKGNQVGEFCKSIQSSGDNTTMSLMEMFYKVVGVMNKSSEVRQLK